MHIYLNMNKTYTYNYTHTHAHLFIYMDMPMRLFFQPVWSPGPGRHIWWWRRSTTRGNSPIWSMATMASKKSLNPTLQQSSAMQRLGELGEWLGDGERVLICLDESCHGEHSNFDMGAQSTTFCKFWAFVISSAAILLGESEWTWWLTVD